MSTAQEAALAHSTSTLLRMTRAKHTWQDKASPCEGSSKDQAPGVSVEHGDQGTEAAGAAQVLNVGGRGHEGMQEVGAVAVQHPLQPHQPLSLPHMHCTVLVKVGMMPGLLLMHDALHPRFKFVLTSIDIASSTKCRVQAMAQVGVLGWASHTSFAMM